MEILENLKHDIMEKVKNIKEDNEIVKEHSIPLVNITSPEVFFKRPLIRISRLLSLKGNELHTAHHTNCG